MDALSVLREFTVRQELGSVHRVDDEFRFGDDYRFPCSSETGYRSKQGPFYTLDCLVFFVKSSDVRHTDYMQQARALKLQIVTFPDRKPLLDYLQGRVATSDAIELLPPPTADHSPRHRPASAADDADADERAKRLKSSAADPSGTLKPLDAALLIELVRGMERPVRDRDTILLCPNKTFQSILGILNRRDDDKRKLEQQQQQQAPPQQPQPQAAPQQQQPAAAQQKFVKVESDHKNPSAPAAAAAAVAGDPKRVPHGHGHGHGHGQQQQHQQQMGGKKSKIEGPPIILVPNASQTLLNTFNAKKFLEDGVYSAEDAKSKKAESGVIQRTIGRDIPVKYEIRDKPTSLSSKDWERVVAVFVLGKEWQFKDWPFKDHVDIFNKILGVYLRFEDDSMESVKVVMQWNVKIISLSKHKRHQDRTAVLEFWDKLDAFIRARRLPILF